MHEQIKHPLRNTFIAFALLVFAHQISFAATVSYTSNFSTSSSTFTSSLNLRQFDPALGTLTSLSLTLLANIDGSAQITNNNSSAQIYSVVFSSALALTDSLNNTLASATPEFSSSIRVAGGGGYTIGATASDNQVSSYADAPTLNEFIGFANFTGTLTGNDQSAFSGPGDTIFTSSASTNGSVVVTYIYSLNPSGPATAPEPATVICALFGVSGLVFVKRRSS